MGRALGVDFLDDACCSNGQECRSPRYRCDELDGVAWTVLLLGVLLVEVQNAGCVYQGLELAAGKSPWE